MEYANRYCVIVAVILSTFLTSSIAIPQDGANAAAAPAPAPAPAPAAAGAPSGAGAPAGSKVINLDEPTTISPEEIAMDEKIVELKTKQCGTMFGNCWASLKRVKSHLTEEIRIKICFKRTKRYMMCTKMTNEQATQAKDEQETKLKKEEEDDQAEEKGDGQGADDKTQEKRSVKSQVKIEQ